MTSALHGITVVDLTHAMAGPYATMLLADMGAEVIKVEPVGTGEQFRRADLWRGQGEDTAAFIAVNRNKQSIELDLKTVDGAAVFRRILADADVLVENFRPGVLDRLGFDFETCAGLNPRLVYAVVSGFGHDGPYARQAGYDLIAQGMAGLMSVTGEAGGEPVKCGLPIADVSGALFCANAILAALMARTHTGRGQRVETSLYDAALALSVWESTEYWSTGHVPEAMGSAHRLTAPYEAVRTADGHVTIAANNDRLWRRLCETIDRLDLLTDQRFSVNSSRMANRPSLMRELEAVLIQRSTEEWLKIFRAVGFPAGAVRNYAEVLNDDHTQARSMVMTIEHPVEGPTKTLGFPMKLSDTPASVRSHAPLLGQHTDGVLSALGYSEQEIEGLRRRGAIGLAHG